MITQKTAADIYHLYRGIEAGNKLLQDLAAEIEKGKFDKIEPNLKDCFGRRTRLELGVPSGDNSHRVFGVAPDLAMSVIRAHIANCEAKLKEAQERARIELATPTPLKDRNIKQTEEIARLCAIVDKLPKTADGVPLTPGCDFWYWGLYPNGIGRLDLFHGECSQWYPFSEFIGGFGTDTAHPVYSTEAAALAVKKEKL